MFAEKLADNDLSKHSFVYFAERLKRNSKLQTLRTPELNAVEQAQAAHLSHHLITRKCVFERLAQKLAHHLTAAAQSFILQCLERRQAGGQGQTVFVVS